MRTSQAQSLVWQASQPGMQPPADSAGHHDHHHRHSAHGDEVEIIDHSIDRYNGVIINEKVFRETAKAGRPFSVPFLPARCCIAISTRIFLPKSSRRCSIVREVSASPSCLTPFLQIQFLNGKLRVVEVSAMFGPSVVDRRIQQSSSSIAFFAPVAHLPPQGCG